MSLRKLGQVGEALAQNYLKQHNCTVITTNYRSRFGEIDIIAKEEDCYVFVEVKTRSSKRFGSPLEAVTFRKRQRLWLTAQDWVGKHNLGVEEPAFRFDVLSIIIGNDGLAAITHDKGVFGEVE
ncbi:UPF0102 protein [Armatimonadota bacterium]|nr:UPF0102 protein [Armatimonadota bacterium]